MLHTERMERIAEERKKADEERAEQRRREDKEWQAKQEADNLNRQEARDEKQRNRDDARDEKQRKWQAKENWITRGASLFGVLVAAVLGFLLGKNQPNTQTIPQPQTTVTQPPIESKGEPK